MPLKGQSVVLKKCINRLFHLCADVTECAGWKITGQQSSGAAVVDAVVLTSLLSGFTVSDYPKTSELYTLKQCVGSIPVN